MKTIKQIISDADPRLKGVLMIMIVMLVGVDGMVTMMTTMKLKVIKKLLKFSIKMVVKKLKII